MIILSYGFKISLIKRIERHLDLQNRRKQFLHKNRGNGDRVG